uniref:Uncharacterized protein n=1 Tax=Lactuca sativa TaxID=4236 RepID=A0A9R1VB58_LACSA|nr:hypothetical protein LSAT_V11C600317310 [Lactuca sativa]
MLFDEDVSRLKAYEEHISGTEKVEDTEGGLMLASEENCMLVDIFLDLDSPIKNGLPAKEVGFGVPHTRITCKHYNNGGSNRDDFGHKRGEVVGLGRVEMIMNMSVIKVTLNVTNVASLVTTTTSIITKWEKQ